MKKQNKTHSKLKGAKLYINEKVVYDFGDICVCAPLQTEATRNALHLHLRLRLMDMMTEKHSVNLGAEKTRKGLK